MDDILTVNNKTLQETYKDSGINFEGEDEEIWEVGSIKVYYKGLLNSGGTVLAKHYRDYIMRRWPGRNFQTGYEIGCGPGFIGFALLAFGVVNELVLSDIEPSCEYYVQKTISSNKLEGRVKFYISDAMKTIPSNSKFDLVVSNPPWKYELTPTMSDCHTNEVAKVHRVDIGMKFTADFFSEISSFLNPGAPILWACGRPLHAEFFRYPGCTVTNRNYPPILDLMKLAEKDHLFVREVVHPDNSLWSFWLLIVEKPRIDLNYAVVI